MSEEQITSGIDQFMIDGRRHTPVKRRQPPRPPNPNRLPRTLRQRKKRKKIENLKTLKQPRNLKRSLPRP